MSGVTIEPRHVLCVLGNGLDFAAVEAIVKEVGGPGFFVDETSRVFDPRMPAAFEASLSNGTFTDADWAAVAGHDSIVYILSPALQVDSSVDISRRLLALTAALLRAGATAVKNESAGLTHGRERWLRLADNAWRPEALYYAWVKRPMTDGTELYSCGMHLLGAPDVEVQTGGPSDPQQLDGRVELIDALALYMLTERPWTQINDGEGFLLTAQHPRWVLRRWRCLRYAADDFFHNPYGYWRLTSG